MSRFVSIRQVGFFLVFFLVAGAGFLSAQTNQELIQNAPWSVYELGEGVVLKTHHFPNLFGGQQDVYITIADLNAPGVSLSFQGVGDGTRKTVPTWAGDVTNAAAAINGAWANPSTGIPDQFLRIGGVDLAETHPVAQERGGIVISSTGAVSCQTRPGDGWGSLPDPDIMASEVPSVVNGAPFAWTSVGAPDYDYYYNTRNPRSAVGMTADNQLIFAVVDGRRAPTAIGVTYAHVAELMIALGAVNATQLDGGGSSTLWGRYYGVANQPSDGSPRSLATALCVVAQPVAKPYNAQLTGAVYNGTMISGSTQTVTLQFQNTGSASWDGMTRLGTSEPRDRESSFFSPSWLSAVRPAPVEPSSVASGQTGSFSFEIIAPVVSTLQTFTESFGLVQEGVEWFGLDQNRLTINVMPEGYAGQTVIIESRSGGQNFSWYSDSGMADSGANCTAPGLTTGIGSRYGSTYRSVAGLKIATFTPWFAEEGDYEVSVAWGAGSNRRAGITYRVVHADGIYTTLLDQSTTANEWISLGTFRFESGGGGSVEISNESIDESGSMIASAARFEFLPGNEVADWDMY